MLFKTRSKLCTDYRSAYLNAVSQLWIKNVNMCRIRGMAGNSFSVQTGFPAKNYHRPQFFKISHNSFLALKVLYTCYSQHKTLISPLVEKLFEEKWITNPLSDAFYQNENCRENPLHRSTLCIDSERCNYIIPKAIWLLPVRYNIFSSIV